MCFYWLPEHHDQRRLFEPALYAQAKQRASSLGAEKEGLLRDLQDLQDKYNRTKDDLARALQERDTFRERCQDAKKVRHTFLSRLLHSISWPVHSGDPCQARLGAPLTGDA